MSETESLGVNIEGLGIHPAQGARVAKELPPAADPAEHTRRMEHIKPFVLDVIDPYAEPADRLTSMEHLVACAPREAIGALANMIIAQHHSYDRLAGKPDGYSITYLRSLLTGPGGQG